MAKALIKPSMVKSIMMIFMFRRLSRRAIARAPVTSCLSLRKIVLVRPGMTVVDLGSAPGGWSRVAAELVGDRGESWLATFFNGYAG